ncbi:hypothetical protein [Alteribacillus sp. HJP-4]|uniref:hypothetical protein n=1 Tax=Alteribacillus sp. HJP-4 TaxID=2775394 RepID=UPI0035CCF507
MAMVKRSFILLMCLSYFIDSFIHVPVIRDGLTIIVVCTFLMTIAATDLKTKLMGGILFSTGLVIDLFVNDKALLTASEGMLQNLPLLVLMTLAPLLSIPLINSTYMDDIQTYLKQIVHLPARLFIGLTAFLTIIAPILSVGSVRVLHDILRHNTFDPSFLARAYFVGFSTAMGWSPYFGSVALTLLYLDLSFSEYVLFGLMLMVLQLVTGNAVFFLFQKKNITIEEKPLRTEKPVNIVPVLLKIVAMLCAMIGTLVWLESVTNLPMLLLVGLTCVIIPLLWAVLLRQWERFREDFLKFFHMIEYGVNTEIVLFLSAGLFGAALADSPFSTVIRRMLEAMSSISFLLVAVIIIVFVIMLAFIGVHQIITIPILAMQISPEMLGTDAVTLAVVFLLAWFLSAIISPFNAITIFIANAVHRSTLTVGLRWNGLYIVGMFLIGMIYVLLLHHLSLSS